MYCIIDIETTGGQFNEEGITEVAIYKFDGHEVVDQFISLINPEKPIQPFVVKLTGINEKMLEFAPKFHEVAKRIVEITADCILVAHNALFDYRILRNEFARLGYDFTSKTICTVELAQNLIPDQPSYSLGKLVRSLGIPMADRHRASGDAMATVKLFKLLLEKDLKKNVLKEFVKQEIEKTLNVKLLEIVQSLPSRTGVFYMHNGSGDIILVGKSRNIRKKINQYFTGTNKKSKLLQKDTVAVTYEETGSDLIGYIKESQEINSIKPLLNSKNTNKKEFPFGLYFFKDLHGYLNLEIRKTDKRKKEITLFTSISDAKNGLQRITSHYQLCPKLTGLFETENACYSHKIGECNGACIQTENAIVYNTRVTEFISKNNLDSTNCIVVDRGRKLDERSAIVLENGKVLGYCFYDLNYQIHKISILKTILIPIEHSTEIGDKVKYTIRRKKYKKLFNF
jgi:DNA polymerase-3 subunit epsilon